MVCSRLSDVRIERAKKFFDFLKLTIQHSHTLFSHLHLSTFVSVTFHVPKPYESLPGETAVQLATN